MFKQSIVAMKTPEAQMIRLLTYFVAFYVKFTLFRWWRQVTAVPTIDGISLAIEGSMWCNPMKKEDDVFIKEGVSITKFKQTIVRYCLLSWAMCLSNISPQLRERFQNPEDFNKYRLMTFDEYRKLKTTHEDSIDGWRMKWTMPLLWANTMLNELESKASKIDDVKILAHKETLKATNAFQQKLQKIIYANINKLHHLIMQAIKIGLVVWVLLGIWSSQGTFSRENVNSMPLALIANFPLMELTELLLVYSWLQTANFLQNPFGFDK